MAKLVRRHTSNVEIISSNLVGSIYFFTLKMHAINNPSIGVRKAFDFLVLILSRFVTQDTSVHTLFE